MIGRYVTETRLKLNKHKKQVSNFELNTLSEILRIDIARLLGKNNFTPTQEGHRKPMPPLSFYCTRQANHCHSKNFPASAFQAWPHL